MTLVFRMVRTILAGVSVVALSATATPAHAATYATGAFHYASTGTGLCLETYAGANAGVRGCSVSLSIASFAVVVHHRDGTCSGAAPSSVMSIVSPSTPSVPAVTGTFVVSHGVGAFTGFGNAGLIAAEGDALVLGSRCTPEVLGETQTFSGTYELSA